MEFSNDNGRRLEDDSDKYEVTINLISSIISSIEPGVETLISHSNRKSLIRFLDYMEERLEFNENNVDKYYMNIGDNYYIKNYIGFQNNEDLEKFLNFDFSLHKRLFPNKISGVFACICLAAYVIFIIMWGLTFLFLDEKTCNMILLNIPFFINLVILSGFPIYSIIIYKDVYKSKDLLELKEIKSDDFINGFITEYISLFDQRIAIIITIDTIVFVFFFQVISMIVLCAS